MNQTAPPLDPPDPGGARAPNVPMPPGVPILGHIPALRRERLSFLERCEREYGDIVALRFGPTPLRIMINGSDLLEQVMVKQHQSFAKNSLFWRHVEALFGQGLLTSHGPLWQRQRKLSAPAFAGQRLLGYAPTMLGAVERMLEGWHDGEVHDVYPEAMVMTLRVASKTLFNAEVDSDVSAMEEAMDLLYEEIGNRFARPYKIPDWLPLRGNVKYRRGIAHVEGLVRKIIAERRAGATADQGDFLSMLMAARDENGQPMSDKQLRDEAVTLLLAGHETTALALTWTLMLLSRHPEMQERLVAEINGVVEPGARPTTADTERMPLLEAVIMESMRLYPPVWVIGREAVEDVVIGDYPIAKGSQIMICAWVAHRSPRYWEAPTEFRPDRWAGNFRRTLPRFAYFPFGGGPRVCIGQRFAMMEQALVLSTILPRFRVHAVDEALPELIPSITLRPRGPVRVRLEARR
jgi:cytochrome P450